MADLFRKVECRCETCSPDPLPTWTRKHLVACEIRDVVALSSNADRRRYIDLVEKHRGTNAAVRLREAVWKEIQELT